MNDSNIHGADEEANDISARAKTEKKIITDSSDRVNVKNTFTGKEGTDKKWFRGRKSGKLWKEND